MLNKGGTYLQKARVVVAVSHFYPSLIFLDKDRSLPLEFSPITDSSREGSGLAQKYLIRVEVTCLES